ncbi:MAG: HD domain-containing protein [Firmicutes bacterium]|nr:HD domain-containing protein [Bacillota bacterium]
MPIDNMLERFRVEQPHARTVSQHALTLFDQLHPLFCSAKESVAAWRNLLEVSALLHDVGYCINKKGHHKHGAYIIRHAVETQSWDPIFRRHVRWMIYVHRKKVNKKWRQKLTEHPALLACAAILRVADGLDRTHDSTVSIAHIAVDDQAVTLTLHGISSKVLEHLLQRKADIWEEGLHRILRIAVLPPAEEKIASSSTPSS